MAVILALNAKSAMTRSYTHRRSINKFDGKPVLNSVRSLQTTSTDNCLRNLYQGSDLTCTANDLEIIEVTGTTVHSTDDVCAEADDYVILSFDVTMTVKNNRYDVGMYINTEGGSATGTGNCAMALLSNIDFQQGAVASEIINVNDGTVTIRELESEANADKCPDIAKTVTGTATLPIRSSFFWTGKTNSFIYHCVRDITVPSSHSATLWDQNDGNYCSPDDDSNWPLPGNPAKCWSERINLAVVEIPLSSSPSISSGPSVSAAPSNKPSVSLSPSLSAIPSSSPSISSGPSVSAAPSNEQSVSVSPSLSTIPSSSPSTSSGPSVSAAPSQSSIPSKSSQPSVSLAPSTSLNPSVSSSPSQSSIPSNKSSHPSLSALPSASVTPSLSLKPSITGSPSQSSIPSMSSRPS
eukprot:scaffold113786_cov47-Cyclotella_meneghiniana.AAC.1